MRVIALVNQKGGVAKSTSTLNIGAGLALRNRRVLLLDMDPQGNCTEGYGVDPEELDGSMYDVLIGGAGIKDVLLNVADGVDLVPANVQLASAEIDLLEQEGDHVDELKKALSKFGASKKYDYVLIDCPPSLGQLTVNALVAAKEVIVPIESEFYALKGMDRLFDTIEAIRSHNNKSLKVTGVLVTKHDARTNLARVVLDQLEQNFSDLLFKRQIRLNVAVKEAPVVGQDIFTYNPTCHGAEDYAAICDEVIAQEVN